MSDDDIGQSKTAEERVAELLQLLDLHDQGNDEFKGRRKRDGIGRVFGGQVISQGLVAAERTVPEERMCHSLHAYFLRGGSEDHAIDYAVDRQFDGRSFANRRVVASQQGVPILNMAASFQLPQDGPRNQLAVMPDVPPPEELPSQHELVRAAWDNLTPFQQTIFGRPQPYEARPVNCDDMLSARAEPPIRNIWIRACAPLPDSPRIHRAVLAYLSDLFLLGTSLMPFGLVFLRDKVKLASLDHAIWFHEPFRVDDWLLYAMDAPWSGHARGFNRGAFFNRDGALVASTVQEGMVREG